MNHILYISYDGMTDPLGQSQVLPYICGLSKYGYHFTLISCEKPDRFKQNKHRIEDICLNNNIHWKPILYHKSPPILSTLWDINQIQKLAYKLNKDNEFDLVHCRGYISALIGLGMKKRFGTKFLFDMRGLWADEKVDAGAWNLSKPHYKAIYNFFKRKEKEFFLNADHSISLTYTGKKEIMSWDYMREGEDNISVIPCCVDTNLFDFNQVSQRDLTHWKAKLGVDEGDIVISYLGSIGTWYMLDEMMDFFVEFQARYPNARFLFITHDEHLQIKNAAKDRNILDKIIIQPAQRNEVSSLLSISALSIFFIRPTYSKISSSPTKQGEIMAMGIPIICNQGVGDTDTIVKNYASGISINHFKNEDYRQAIEEYSTTMFSKNDIRKGALDYFSLDKGVEAYLRIYKNCIPTL